MRKKISILLASLTVLAFGVFTISNAFALNYYDWAGTGIGTQGNPLSSQVKSCKDLKANYKADVETMKAKGLSGQLSKEDMKWMVEGVKYSRDWTCLEAQDPATLARVCKSLKTDWGKEVQRIKAKGLSSQLSGDLIQEQIAVSRKYKNDLCKQARVAKTGKSPKGSVAGASTNK